MTAVATKEAPEATKAETARALLEDLEERRAAALADVDRSAVDALETGEPPDLETLRGPWTDAALLERIIDRVRPTVERLERWQSEEERREAERRRDEATEAREAAEAEALQEAVSFLELQVSGSPVPKGKLLAEAEAAGVQVSHLLEAAAQLGVRELGWLKSGTRTVPTGERMWGHPPVAAGPMDLGPAKP